MGARLVGFPRGNIKPLPAGPSFSMYGTAQLILCGSMRTTVKHSTSHYKQLRSFSLGPSHSASPPPPYRCLKCTLHRSLFIASRIATAVRELVPARDESFNKAFIMKMQSLSCSSH